MKKVLVFAGSNSSTSINQKLAEFAASLAQSAVVTIIELRDYPAPVFREDIEKGEGYPQSMIKLNELIKEQDGFIISLPEYNSSITPVFKNTVDWISRIERPTFKNKPVMLLSTSNGARGAMSNLSYVESVIPRWGGIVTGTFSLPSFSENMNTDQTRIENSEELVKLKEHISIFESKL